MNDINTAANIAVTMHRDQVRKYTDAPYIIHPAEVALLTDMFGGSKEQIAAAWLHDVVEDTSMTLDEIFMVFGEGVADLVGELTDQYTKEAYPLLNREKRKALERERLYTISPEAALVKACDMLDNTRDITEHDPDYAKVYLREKARLALKMNIPNEELRTILLNQIPDRYIEEIEQEFENERATNKKSY